MGDSVTIRIKQDVLPAAQKEIEAYCAQFQDGSFNGIEDIYEYNNRRNDIPQAKYVHVTFEYSDELMQSAWDSIRAFYGLTDAPTDLKQGRNYRFHDMYGSDAVYRVLTGKDRYCPFWQSRKPRITLQAA